MNLTRKIRREYQSRYGSKDWIALANRLKQERESCECCGSQSNLTVHHKVYFSGRKVHEYEDSDLIVLCKPCHDEVTEFADMIWMLALSFSPNQAPRLHKLVVAVSENKDRNLDAATRACESINLDLCRSGRVGALLEGLRRG
jgi:hypothetical protein